MRRTTFLGKAMVGVAVLTGVCALGVELASARPFTFTKRQLSATPTGTADEVVLNSLGDRVAFIHSVDGNPEVYTATVSPSGLGSLTQITQTVGNIQAHPILSSFGSVLLFQSNANLDLVIGNPDGSPETFRAEAITPGTAFRQLTFNQTGVSPLPQPNPAGRISHASANGDGDLIVFSSPGTGIPAQYVNNPEGNPEVFLYDRIDEQYFQLTSTGGGVNNLHPVIDGFGTAVSYVSNEDGNYEVYVVAVAESDPCTVDPTAPGCDPCTVDPTAPGCDPCVIDPDAPGCDPCQSSNPPPSCFGSAPAITITPPGDQTVDERVAIAPITIGVTDADGDPFTFRANLGSAIGARLTVTRAFPCDATIENCSCDPKVAECTYFSDIQAQLSWTPDSQAGGASQTSYPFVFTVRDLINETAPPITGSVNVTVRNANRPPTISPSSLNQTIKIGRDVSYTLSGSDPDNDPLTMTAGQRPSWMTFSAQSGSTATRPQYRLAGTASTVGTYPLEVGVGDGSASATATGTLTVVLNRAPVINVNNVTTSEGACLTSTPSGSDLDSDPLTFSVDQATMPAESVWLGGTRTFHWHPNFNLATPGTPYRHNVTFCTSDGTDTTCKTITITVNDTPLDNSVILGSGSTMTVQPGATVPLTMTAQNTGYSTWTAGNGYALSSGYVSSGMTAPTPVPVSSGASVSPGGTTTFTTTLQAPTSPGTYYTSFRMSQGGQAFGSSSPYTVLQVSAPTTPPSTSTATLTVSPTTVVRGGTLTVSWSVASGRVQDWIGFFKVGAPNTSYVWWKYTNGLTSGSIMLAAPTTAGSYEFRYLLNNGFTDSGRSGTVTVQ